MRLKVCRVEDLPKGGVRTLRVLARTVAIFNAGGQYCALEADCKHMKASIAHGKLEGTIITCPAHGWQYDITTGQCLNEPWAKLRTFPVTIENSEIVVEVTVGRDS